MHDIPVDILYLDWAKAFDTVPHQRLLHQVETFGITRSILKWIQAFLTDRQQKSWLMDQNHLGPALKVEYHRGSYWGLYYNTLYYIILLRCAKQ